MRTVVLLDWKKISVYSVVGLIWALSSGCSSKSLDTNVALESLRSVPDYQYVIGPGDSVNVFVWRNSEVSTSVTVRPDGKITTPLVEDLQASGKTPSQLARNIEEVLSTYIKEPSVTVVVSGFVGPYNQQVRVVGEAAQPQALAYREHMTLLDVMIAVGGLTEYAAGNKARLTRYVNGEEQTFVVRAADLTKDGDISANVYMLPGDVLIIPETWF